MAHQPEPEQEESRVEPGEDDPAAPEAEEVSDEEVEQEMISQDALAASWVLRMLSLWALVGRGTIHPGRDGESDVTVYKIGSWAPLLRATREWPYAQDSVVRTMKTMRVILREMNREDGWIVMWKHSRDERLAAAALPVPGEDWQAA